MINGGDIRGEVRGIMIKQKGGHGLGIKASLVVAMCFTTMFMVGGCLGISQLSSNNPPVAVIKANPATGLAPLEVLFDASESFDHDGDDIVSYSWDFGDGNKSANYVVRHGFSLPGNYTVVLTVVDKRGGVGSATLTIVVQEPSSTMLTYQFEATAGGEFDTGTGLKVCVPPAPAEGSMTLVVSINRNCTQPPGEVINLNSVYNVYINGANVIGGQRLSQEQITMPPYVDLHFDIPADADPDYFFLFAWTESGWHLAGLGYGHEGFRYLGGILTPDKRRLVFRLYLVGMAASTYVKTYSQPPVACFGTGVLNALECRGGLKQARSFGKPNIDVSQLPRVRLRSPGIPDIGGLWYKVEVSGQGVKQYEWHPPDPNEPRAFGIDGTPFLEPTVTEEGVLVLHFSSSGGEVRICLNALDDGALWRTAADILPLGTAITVGKLVTEVLRPLVSWAITGKAEVSPRAILDYLRSLGVDVVTYLTEVPDLLVKLPVVTATMIETRGKVCKEFTVTQPSSSRIYPPTDFSLPASEAQTEQIVHFAYEVQLGTSNRYFTATIAPGGNTYVRDFTGSGALSGRYTGELKYIAPKAGETQTFTIQGQMSPTPEGETNSDSETVTFKVTVLPLPDLTISSVSAPGSARVGDTIEVKFTVENKSGPVSQGFVNRVFLSSKRYGGGQDIPLGDFPMTLNGTKSKTETVRVAIPQVNAGPWYLAVFTDANQSVKESEENNNIGSASITITSAAPPTNQPPVIESLLANPPSVEPGGQSRITVSARDPEGDSLTYTWSATGGALSGTTGPDEKIWTAPNTPGTYRITVSVTDNQPGRSSVSRSVEVTVVQQPAPSFDFEISLNPPSVTVEQGGTISTTIRGWRTAGPTTSVSFSIINLPNGVTANPFSWSWDLGNQNRDVTFSVGSNAPVGTHIIKIRGTGGGRTKEATFTLTIVGTTPQLPDLMVDDIWTDPNPPFTSNDVVIGARIRNRGTADVTTPFLLSVRLLDSAYRPIYARTETISRLSAGQSYTSIPTSTARWPSDTAACTIEVVIDPEGKILESDRANNTLTKQVQAVLPPTPVGTLLVSSDPGEADVYVDGEYKGKTPKEVILYLPIPNLAAGPHTIRISKSGYKDWVDTVLISAGGETRLTVHLSIVEPSIDRLPEIIRPEPGEILQAKVGEAFTYQVEARDPDGQPLTYVLQVWPDDMTIDHSTGMIRWTPGSSWAGRKAEVTFYVSDRPLGQTSGREVYRTFYIDIESIPAKNQPPVIESFIANPTTVQPGGQSRITVSARDPEGDPLTYTWSASGGTLSSTTGPGEKTWTAPNTPGTYRITVSVTDNQPGHSPVSRSVDIEVKTPPPQGGPPRITSYATSNVQATSITLKATVNPNGLTTTVYFEWGLTTSYGNRTPEQNIGAGTTDVNVTVNLTNLASDTVYHWRVVAINSAGAVQTHDITFKTAAPPPQAFEFEITVNPSSWTARQNDMTSITVRAWRTAGSTTSVSFSIVGLPSGVTANPSSWSWDLGDQIRTVTFSVSPNAPVGTYAITIGGTVGGKTKTVSFALTIIGKFKPGDPVYVYGTGGAGLRVRDTPCGKQIGNKPDGSTGVVLEGPVVCVLEGKTYRWWKIRWSDGLVGWSVEDYLGLALG